MLTEDFDYELPEKNIAQAPAEPRDSCNMLVLHREDGSIEHKIFKDIIDFAQPGNRADRPRSKYDSITVFAPSSFQQPAS